LAINDLNNDELRAELGILDEEFKDWGWGAINSH
jgi:hypothetical protein